MRVEAPMCVQTAFYTRERGKQLVAHLLNEINTTADRAQPTGNSSMREEIIPVGGIKVQFVGAVPAAVHREPGPVALKVEEELGASFVRLPSLELHALCVAEWGAAK